MTPALRTPKKSAGTAMHPDHAGVEALAKRLAVQAGQDANLTVETTIRPRLNGGYSYRDDTVAVALPLECDAGDPNVEATIAHELGHRGEPDHLMRNRALGRALEIVRAAGSLLLIVVGIAAELRGWGLPAAIVGCLAAALLWLYLLGVVKWPREYAADTYAARLIGNEATIANLQTLPAGWVDLDHPPRRFRINAVRRLGGI